MFITNEIYKTHYTYHKNIIPYNITAFSNNGNHSNKFHTFNYIDFFEIFYNEKEIRLKKLNKICQI